MDFVWCLMVTSLYCAIGIFFAWLMNANEGEEIAFAIAFWPMVVFVAVVFILFVYLPYKLVVWVRDKFFGDGRGTE